MPDDSETGYDETGKVSFEHIYTEPDPRAYFSTLRGLDYCIPELATPWFLAMLRRRRERGLPAGKVIDVGCSYGVNAALLRCGLTMTDLYDRYCGPRARSASRAALAARDRELVRSRTQLHGVRFTGLDSSRPALAYATAAGFLDGAVHGDLETSDPTPAQRAELAGADLVISTGCIGYITAATITRVLAATGRRRPWMAHFVLRMFPFTPVSDALAAFGYQTVGYEHVFRQRRFASEQEQSLILGTLAEAGVDARGLEDDGWLYARLFVSWPHGEAGPAPLAPDPDSER